MKKLVSLLLIAVMLFSITSQAFAMEVLNVEEEMIPRNSQIYGSNYEKGFFDILAERMDAKDTHIRIRYTGKLEDLKGNFWAIYDSGKYPNLDYHKALTVISFQVNENLFEFNVSYYLNKEQDKIVDNFIDAEITKMKLLNLGTHDQVRNVHDKICLISEFDSTLNLMRPTSIIESGKGNNIAYATLFYKFMKKLNIPTRLALAKIGTSDEGYLNMVEINNKWYNLSVATDDFLSTRNNLPMRVYYDTYLKSDSTLYGYEKYPEYPKALNDEPFAANLEYYDYTQEALDYLNGIEPSKPFVSQPVDIPFAIKKDIENTVSLQVDHRTGKTVNDQNYTWTITFNQEISPATANHLIWVYDSVGSPVDFARPTVDTANKKKVKITPTQKYDKDKLYYIIIDGSSASEVGGKLNKAVSYPFKVTD